MQQELTMGSLFSGSGGFELASAIFGIEPRWASEIEPLPMLITKKNFPDMLPYVSSTLSPMAMIGKHIKEQDPTAKVVFIGPCTAKKMEIRKETVAPYIDSALTFEELQAVLDSREIDITTLEEESLENASYFGRIFAHTGCLLLHI